MKSIQERQEALARQFDRITNSNYWPAQVGDANGNMDGPNGTIIVRELTSNGLSAPRNVQPPMVYLPLAPGYNVELEYNKHGLPYIARGDTKNNRAASQSVLPTPPKEPTAKSKLAPLSVVPTNPPSMAISIKSWNPIINNVFTPFVGIAEEPASAPSAGNMYYAVWFVKSDLQTAEVFYSTARGINDIALNEDDVNEALAQKTSGSTPVWAQKLIGGQTAITDNDLNNDGIPLQQSINVAQDALPILLTVKEQDGSPTVSDVNTIKVTNGTLTDDGGGVVSINTGGSSGAPTTATYITQTPDAGLSAEQALSSLATGILKNTTGTGIVSIATGSDLPAHNHAATDINSAQLALARGGTHADLSAAGPGALWQATNGADISVVEPQILRVKNTSGATANANHVGYLAYTAGAGREYKTTTTANLEANWCVVVVGGANNADILVAQAGRVTVELNANCSIGDFLTTSTTAGRAAVNTLMRPEVFAIAQTANAGGAGGTCSALLCCKSQIVSVTDTNFLMEILSSSTTAFVATINGTPSATSVVYNNPSSGNENTIVPGAAGDLLKARLWNTTRGTSRLITAVNTGTNTITTVSSTDSWASGDTITIESQTVVSGTANKFVDYDFSQTSVFPALMRAIFLRLTFMDSGAGTNNQGFIHPYKTYANPQSFTLIGQGAGLYATTGTPPIPVISGVLTASVLGSGVGSANFFVQTFAAVVAA